MVPLNSHHTVHSHGMSPLHPIWPEFFLLTLGKPTISDGKSQFFIDFHASQTVSNCQRKNIGISVYPYILSPFFLLNSPFFQAKWVGNPWKSGIPKHTTFSSVVRFLDFLRIFSRFSFAYWSLSGMALVRLMFGRIRFEGEKVMLFLWSFLDKMMFLCFVCFVDWRYWRWILKRFNHWHPLT